MTTSDPTTTAPQPATPGQALRWARDRLITEEHWDGPPLGLLSSWADELDAAPTVYDLPPEPPASVVELWDRKGRRWQRKPWRWHADGTEAGPDEAWIWELNGRGLRLRFHALLANVGRLSTTPPAGTTTTEETPDA